MIEGNLVENDFGKIITISDPEKSFDIFYGGNGDLYFSPNLCGKSILKMSEPIEFVIDDPDSEIYHIFFNLYKKITEYKPFDREKRLIDETEEDDLRFPNDEDEDETELEREKDSYRKYPLVHEGIISWHSDEDIDEESSILNIRMDGEKIILQFEKSKPSDTMFQTYAIRFRNSGSSYTPFNCRFMELYNKLLEMDFDYHQITMKEYMDSQKVYVKKEK